MLKHDKAADGIRIYLIGFTNVKNADIKAEFGDQFSEFDDEGQQRRFTSVSEMDSFFSERFPAHSNPAP